MILISNWRILAWFNFVNSYGFGKYGSFSCLYKIINYIPNKTLGLGEVAIDSILISNTIKTKSITMQD